MPPRRLLPGGTHFITRRTFEGIFRCAPLEKINEIMLFCLNNPADIYGIEVHGFCFMSNHFHLVVSDPYQNLSDFMQWMNKHSAKCINFILGRQGLVWEPGSFSSQELHTAEDIMDKLVYTISNPTKHEAVPHPQEWIGGVSLPEHYREDFEFKAKRPKFFKENSPTVPESASMKLTVPPLFEDKEAFVNELESKINNRCEEIAEELRQSKEKFRGAENICLDLNYRPPNPQIKSKLNPRIACKNKELRKKLLEGMILFWKEHRESSKRVAQGVKDVIFPYGTYWWCRYGGMKCAKKPPGLP